MMDDQFDDVYLFPNWGLQRRGSPQDPDIYGYDLLRSVRGKIRQQQRNRQGWSEYTNCVNNNPAVIQALQQFRVDGITASLEAFDWEGMLLEAGSETAYHTYKKYKVTKTIKLATKANVMSLATSFIIAALIAKVPDSQVKAIRDKLDNVVKPVSDVCMKQVTGKYGFTPTLPWGR